MTLRNLKNAVFALTIASGTMIANPGATKNTTILNFGPVEITHSCNPLDESTTTATLFPADDETPPIASNRWGTLKTLCAGILIGSAFGAINYVSDPMFKNHLPWNWFLLSASRRLVIQDIADNAKSSSEYVNRNLLCETAWISDWVAYLLAYKIMHNTTPWGNSL